MFDKIITTEQFNIQKLQPYRDTKLYHYQNELLKIIPKKEVANVKKMHQYFLKNPDSMCITPNIPVLHNNQYVGYTIKQENSFIPLSKIKEQLTDEEKTEVIKQVYTYLLANNSVYIYTDIDDDNILYSDGKIKIIDFDNICFTDELDESSYNYSIRHQKYIHNLFSIALYYNTTIDQIYMLNKSNMFTEEQKSEISNILSQDNYITDFSNISINKISK